jgi:hypothetical protein
MLGGQKLNEVTTYLNFLEGKLIILFVIFRLEGKLMSWVVFFLIITLWTLF